MVQKLTKKWFTSWPKANLKAGQNFIKKPIPNQPKSPQALKKRREPTDSGDTKTEQKLAQNWSKSCLKIAPKARQKMVENLTKSSPIAAATVGPQTHWKLTKNFINR